MGFIEGILVGLLLIIISALPLYFAVKLLGGKTGLLKVILVNIGAGILIPIINQTVPFWGTLIAFIILIWIYREMFRLKWWKAFVAWILQMVFLAILIVISTLLFGVALATHFIW